MATHHTHTHTHTYSPLRDAPNERCAVASFWRCYSLANLPLSPDDKRSVGGAMIRAAPAKEVDRFKFGQFRISWWLMLVASMIDLIMMDQGELINA